MRLGRSVLAGLVAGAVAGFLVALLRPRGTHPAAPMAPGFLPEDHLAPLTEPAPRDEAAQAPAPEGSLSVATAGAAPTAPGTAEAAERAEPAATGEPIELDAHAATDAPTEPRQTTSTANLAGVTAHVPVDGVRAQD